MTIYPDREITAELSYLEFHNTKNDLAWGTYQVNEADGDISYATIGEYGQLTWFSKDEYDELAREQSQYLSEWERASESAADDLFNWDENFLLSNLEEENRRNLEP